MAEFLTTQGTSYNIENIILNAKKELFLVTPFLQLSKTFFERLMDASVRGVNIKIIFGKDDLKPNERNSLTQINHLELFYFENLHAKCYFNEESMVITSMNMYDFSEKNNREMGVFILKVQDKDLYERAVSETMSIIYSSEVIELRKTEKKYPKVDYTKVTSYSKRDKKQKDSRGYCIRCEQRIPYDPSRPYCLECFSVWAIYSNTEFKETVCHSCGEYFKTSMKKPLCGNHKL